MNIFKRADSDSQSEGEVKIDRPNQTAGTQDPSKHAETVSVPPTKRPVKGLFIVIEGSDGSGKATQVRLLRERLQSRGYEVAEFDFPRYDEPSSYFVRQYLNGEYGAANDVGPYVCSLFYALDRYVAAKEMNKALDAGKIVLANRYVGSNMAHQGTKLPQAEQRRNYFIWLDNLEFEMLKVPRPDLNLVLRVPADIAQTLVDKKDARKYTDKKRDLHEADLAHLKRAIEVFDDMCQLFPKDFQCLDCIRDGSLLSIDDIRRLVWEKVSPRLPPPAARPEVPAIKVEELPEPQLDEDGKTDSDNTSAAEPLSAGTPSLQNVPAASVTSGPLPHQPAAPESKQSPAKGSNNPYVTRQGVHTVPTQEGMAYLEQAVSNATGTVYAFTDKLSSATIAAAMARLCRRGDDLRVTLLDEFAFAQDSDQQLLQRVITAYGDDSVQQLVGQHFVIEQASNLLTKKLEWGRLAAYVEQSTRYIYFDQKDHHGRYKYYVPEDLDTNTRADYEKYMDQIFDRYSKMVRDLTHYIRSNDKTPEAERDGAWKGATRAQACDAIRPVLPTATTSTVGIFASGQALESLIMHLLSDELPEARQTGIQLLNEARKVLPTFLERADNPERGGAAVAYRATTASSVKSLAQQYLPDNYATDAPRAVTLTDVWPRNELSLVADMLYEHGNLPLQTLRDEVEQWPYDKKTEVFMAYMGERLNRRHRPGRALEKAHYSWDLLCDYGIFRDLQRHRMVDDLEWQALTPRYGFEVPKLVEDAGLADLFEDCFDISLKLYSILQSAYPLEAQYATLLGHKLRWKVTYNAREAFHLHELRTSPQGHPGYRTLVNQMHEELRRVHPLMADAMKFVNADEDPALTRLAAERYTQYKLQNLS